MSVQQETQVSREYRIAVSGPPAVGKSALTVRFTQALFVDEYDPTIEDSYKHYATIENRQVLLDILDTAGQEDYASMKESYMRRGEGFLLVFSVTSLSSFESIQAFYDQIIRVKEDVEFVPIILIGNKSDLSNTDEREVSQEKAVKLAKDLKIPYLETSAKLDQNVNEAFYSVVKMINRSGAIKLDHITGQEVIGTTATTTTIGGGATTTTGGANNTTNNHNNNKEYSNTNDLNNTNNNINTNQNNTDNARSSQNKKHQGNNTKESSSSSGGGCCVIV